MQNRRVHASPASEPGYDALIAALALIGDEARLPAGSTLADHARPGWRCFLILEGRAVAETPGQQPRILADGAFVGDVDADGLPVPLADVTVWLQVPARVLVLDPARLAARITAQPELSVLWRAVITGR